MKRFLGELEVSFIGLGCMGMSIGYGKANLSECRKVLKRALDLGISFFDTADAYGFGRNEELLGEVLGNDPRALISTKFGFKKGKELRVDGSPRRVKECCEASLRRLRRDVIDLYYLHRVDPFIPIEDTFGAMSELVREGKVRYLGLSEINSSSLLKAHGVHSVTAVQSEFSLWTRTPENEIMETCRRLNVGFVPYSPLGRGMFTNKVPKTEQLEKSDVRNALPRFEASNFQKNKNALGDLGQLAEEKGVAIGQLALSWILAKGEFIVPIPGTKRIEFLEENIGCSEISLSLDDIRRLESLFPQSGAWGNRYRKEMLGLTQQESA